ncbi:SDR family NAD(P)-dependent oxidoreductase [Kitasatospora sp. DSM 101779]|uniref:SDR family NAD(P)-dependent oxidoreductase n=1 Tax=Kitasatospora sp. DSM 101779 TaxID=2853165 RepID=UPI00295375F1|nr:SDR family NAD(P)-dependent oxidoreductase [Kitasatospora sp. DSM 101779]
MPARAAARAGRHRRRGSPCATTTTASAGATAPVTGGSRGLGLLIAGEVADRGARVMICARDPQELATAEGELSRRGTVATTDSARRSRFDEGDVG